MNLRSKHTTSIFFAVFSFTLVQWIFRILVHYWHTVRTVLNSMSARSWFDRHQASLVGKHDEALNLNGSETKLQDYSTFLVYRDFKVASIFSFCYLIFIRLWLTFCSGCDSVTNVAVKEWASSHFKSSKGDDEDLPRCIRSPTYILSEQKTYLNRFLMLQMQIIQPVNGISLMSD